MRGARRRLLACGKEPEKCWSVLDLDYRTGRPIERRDDVVEAGLFESRGGPQGADTPVAPFRLTGDRAQCSVLASPGSGATNWTESISVELTMFHSITGTALQGLRPV